MRYGQVPYRISHHKHTKDRERGFQTINSYLSGLAMTQLPVRLSISLSVLLSFVLFSSACSLFTSEPDKQTPAPVAAPAAEPAALAPAPAAEVVTKSEESVAAETAAVAVTPVAPPPTAPMEQIPETAKTSPAPAAESPPAAAPSKPAAPASEATHEMAPAMDVPAKKGPNHFVITRGEKGPDHPGFGKGSHMGFFLDGKPGTPAVLKRGVTYEIDVRTDPLHDVYLSTTPAGWGGGPVVDGVKGQFTYMGTITFTPGETTPDVVYYSCRNHSTMGWKLHVVNKDTSDSEIKKILADAQAELKQLAQANAGASVKKDQGDAKAKQKLSLAGMMLSSGGVKRVMGSGDAEAKGMIADAKSKIEKGNEVIKTGAADQAMALADDALKLISAAQRLVPTDEELKEQEAEYTGNLITVEQFEISHKEQYDDTVKRRGKKEAIDYDKAKVKQLVDEAKAMAAKKKYVHANENLLEAERMITSSIQQMMDKQQIVYELKFNTPKDEYDYELRRYKGYEDLVPVAIEQKAPNENLKKLMDMYVQKGKEQKAAAEGKAKEGDYPLAISMILSATEQIRLALRTVGVSQ